MELSQNNLQQSPIVTNIDLISYLNIYYFESGILSNRALKSN